jgi:hypothetical protein
MDRNMDTISVQIEFSFEIVDSIRNGIKHLLDSSTGVR